MQEYYEEEITRDLEDDAFVPKNTFKAKMGAYSSELNRAVISLLHREFMEAIPSKLHELGATPLIIDGSSMGMIKNPDCTLSKWRHAPDAIVSWKGVMRQLEEYIGYAFPKETQIMHESNSAVRVKLDHIMIRENSPKEIVEEHPIDNENHILSGVIICGNLHEGGTHTVKVGDHIYTITPTTDGDIRLAVWKASSQCTVDPVSYGTQLAIYFDVYLDVNNCLVLKADNSERTDIATMDHYSVPNFVNYWKGLANITCQSALHATLKFESSLATFLGEHRNTNALCFLLHRKYYTHSIEEDQLSSPDRALFRLLSKNFSVCFCEVDIIQTFFDEKCVPSFDRPHTVVVKKPNYVDEATISKVRIIPGPIQNRERHKKYKMLVDPESGQPNKYKYRFKGFFALPHPSYLRAVHRRELDLSAYSSIGPDVKRTRLQ